MTKNPESVFTKIAVDAWMFSCWGDYVNRKLGPGQYLEKRVSEEDREVLKNLKSEDTANCNIFTYHQPVQSRVRPRFYKLGNK